MFSNEYQSQVSTKGDYLKGSLVDQAFLTAHHLISSSNYSGFFFWEIEMWKSKLGWSRRVRKDMLGLLEKGKLFWECGISPSWKDLLNLYVSMFYIIWCISLFFEDCCSRWKTRGLGHPDNISKHLWVKQIKRVNDEEQLLRIFRSLYFEIKCSNSNVNSPVSDVCHPHPKLITRLSKKLPFHSHFYLTSRQQQNITANAP